MATFQNSLTFVISISLLSSSYAFHFSLYNYSAIELPSLNFNSVSAAAASSSSSGCDVYPTDKHTTRPNPINPNLKLHLKHRPLHQPNSSKHHSLNLTTHKDLARIQSLLSLNRTLPPEANIAPPPPNHTPPAGEEIVVTLESGVSLGSGEYFMDVFIGTPPAHFSLILDTGSDLNWVQCLPCHDCFDQHGPLFDPLLSSSYQNIACADPRCSLVSSPDPPRTCNRGKNDPCPYFYWYGDKSNTTGDLALETFTVNLTSKEPHRLDQVIFGCGHWNRGLFHGAAGLLGLGRGPLSFASQLKEQYGHTFSYCLVDRNSDLSVSSKLIFGEDQSLAKQPRLNYTSFVRRSGGKENVADTFYYVQVKGVKVGGELVQIPTEAWELSEDGSGGTIIDSGTTLSYFADPAYASIREAFIKRVKYPMVPDFPVLNPCYNVSGVGKVVMPGFSIVFGDGAIWDFPMENYFIRLEPEEIMCLAILGTPKSSLSIIGNYQQQNFHMLYDTKKGRLGFAPMRCAEV